MTYLVFSALLLGLIGGVIPGPVLTAVFTEILISGLFKSFRLIFWALLIETIIALISILTLSYVNLSEAFFQSISIIGAAILIWISISIWKINKIDIQNKNHLSIGKITLMITTNGMLWTYWITVCFPKAVLLNEEILYGQYLFMILVQIGWLVSTIILAFMFSKFRKILSNPNIVPFVYKIFALAFLYFAFDMLYKSIMFFVA